MLPVRIAELARSFRSTMRLIPALQARETRCIYGRASLRSFKTTMPPGATSTCHVLLGRRFYATSCLSSRGAVGRVRVGGCSAGMSTLAAEAGSARTLATSVATLSDLKDMVDRLAVLKDPTAAIEGWSSLIDALSRLENSNLLHHLLESPQFTLWIAEGSSVMQNFMVTHDAQFAGELRTAGVRRTMEHKVADSPSVLSLREPSRLDLQEPQSDEKTIPARHLMNSIAAMRRIQQLAPVHAYVQRVLPHVQVGKLGLRPFVGALMAHDIYEPATITLIARAIGTSVTLDSTVWGQAIRNALAQAGPNAACRVYAYTARLADANPNIGLSIRFSDAQRIINALIRRKAGSLSSDDNVGKAMLIFHQQNKFAVAPGSAQDDSYLLLSTLR